MAKIAGQGLGSYKGPVTRSFMSAWSAARIVALASALSCGLASTALAQKIPDRPPPPENAVPQRILKVFPFDTTWTAISLNDKPFTGERPSFFLDKQFRSRGFSGCNTYSATTYSMQSNMAVGPIATTKVTCDKALNDLERAFLTALRTSQMWELKEGKLVLRGPNGVLVFERSL